MSDGKAQNLIIKVNPEDSSVLSLAANWLQGEGKAFGHIMDFCLCQPLQESSLPVSKLLSFNSLLIISFLPY